TEAHALEGGVQTIAQGPVAALEFIKNLGSNGGGFFNANGAHPYENPTPLANFLGLLAIAVLPASLTITFGHMTGRPRAALAASTRAVCCRCRTSFHPAGGALRTSAARRRASRRTRPR